MAGLGVLSTSFPGSLHFSLQGPGRGETLGTRLGVLFVLRGSRDVVQQKTVKI